MGWGNEGGKGGKKGRMQEGQEDHMAGWVGERKEEKRAVSRKRKINTETNWANHTKKKKGRSVEKSRAQYGGKRGSLGPPEKSSFSWTSSWTAFD